MTHTIIAALIAAAASIICQIIISRREKSKDDVCRALRQKELDVRLDGLEEHVKEHNNYAKMFQESSKNLVELSTEIKLLSVDVKYLKEGLFANGK